MEKYNKKILIIEDEQALRVPLSATFEAAGFQVITANNGEDGLKLALEKNPDIILLDLLMPKMDGRVMLRKLRESQQGKDTPVIILTVLQADDLIMHWIAKYEPTYYLIKSDWGPEQIVKKVKERLSIQE